MAAMNFHENPHYLVCLTTVNPTTTRTENTSQMYPTIVARFATFTEAKDYAEKRYNDKDVCISDKFWIFKPELVVNRKPLPVEYTYITEKLNGSLSFIYEFEKKDQ